MFRTSKLARQLVSLYLSDLEEMGERSYWLSTCHFSYSGYHTICVCCESVSESKLMALVFSSV